MMAMTQQTEVLLRKAALLRAGGMPWKQVAVECNRKLNAIEKWPGRYPVEWVAAFNQARADVIDEAEAEAMRVLRGELRGDEPPVRVTAATGILRHATANRPQKVDVNMVVQQTAAGIEEVAASLGLPDETIDALLEGLGARLAGH